MNLGGNAWNGCASSSIMQPLVTSITQGLLVTWDQFLVQKPRRPAVWRESNLGIGCTVIPKWCRCVGDVMGGMAIPA